ncbi:MAG: ketoacyl-ACP synthase III [Planctomycetota bacterium]|nr:ketoacyl-ACP synthase III [Planctomycetota bacterium]RLS40552.1 MAG: ketoacyl-ACP synthase III [Planctomycetota bacterium]
MSDERTSHQRPKCFRLAGIQIEATGSYVPDLVITNEQLHKELGCDSEWIVKRTGILERRHALPHQATTDLCQIAAQRCLDKSDYAKESIDLLVLGTFTPDMSFPSSACLLQDRLGLRCPAIEVQAACAGFMYALTTGASYMLAGAAERVMVVGGDTNSRVINPKDIKTYPLFGDGAGAVILTRGNPDQGLLSVSLGSDGGGGDLLNRPACGSRMPPTAATIEQGLHFLHMDGRAVFRWAVTILCDSIQDVLRHTGLSTDEVDLYIPHQANIRIINAAVDVLKVPRSKVFSNLEKYGNTSAGSIPIALDEALAQGRVKRGQTVVISGFGAGLTWGTAVLKL